MDYKGLQEVGDSKVRKRKDHVLGQRTKIYKRASNIKSKATRKKEQTAKRVAKRKREGRTYQFAITDAENRFVCART